MLKWGHSKCRTMCRAIWSLTFRIWRKLPLTINKSAPSTRVLIVTFDNNNSKLRIILKLLKILGTYLWYLWITLSAWVKIYYKHRTRIWIRVLCKGTIVRCCCKVNKTLWCWIKHKYFPHKTCNQQAEAKSRKVATSLHRIGDKIIIF